MEGSVFGGAVCAVCDERLEAEGQQPLQEQQPHCHSAPRCTGGSAAGSGGGNGEAAGEGAAPPASCKPATAIGVILGRATLYPTSPTLTWLFSYLQEARSLDDSSMDKSGANGSETASAATAAAGSTDWQKGNPQLSALLSQQAVSSVGGGAVVINGAAATAAGAVVSM